jgi:hypothetical protein
MNIVLLDGFSIRNADANFTIGEVRPTNGARGPFRVFACVHSDDDVGTIEVAVVASLDECLPALANYYEQNPPRWVRKGLGWYEKETLYSNLRVEQNQQGRWQGTAIITRCWEVLGPKPFSRPPKRKASQMPIYLIITQTLQ